MTEQYAYLTPQGVIVPDTQTTLATVQDEWKQALGSDLVVTADTPQGVMIVAEALARNNVIKNNADLANQINPNVAGGSFLDAIGALTGIQRNVQTPTTVSGVTISGVAGTVLPIGAQAKTDAGDLFGLTTEITIPDGGTTTGTFQSAEYGPIPCPTDELTNIVTAVLGWETVTNPIAGVLGTTTQSDQSFRAYRLNTLAFQGLSLSEAITSALYAVAGVTSLSYCENYNSVPQGMIVPVMGGATLDDTTWGMTTTAGSGTNGAIVIGTDDINFAETTQTPPAFSPWPTAAYTTTGDITLSGTTTQGGGDWGGSLTVGQIILVKDQTDETENGVWVAASGAWARHPGNADGESISGSNQGISLVRNSVYACVEGGTSTDIAAALLENKSSGAAWNGGTAVSIVEPATGQTYTVLYDVPTRIGILINVTATGVTVDQVKKAILDYQAGTVTDPAGNPSSLQGFRVGQPVSPFEIAGAIVTENPGCYVSVVEIAISEISPSFATAIIPIGLNEIAYTTDGNIVVTVG